VIYLHSIPPQIREFIKKAYEDHTSWKRIINQQDYPIYVDFNERINRTDENLKEVDDIVLTHRRKNMNEYDQLLRAVFGYYWFAISVQKL
jgi:hypothetical protein